jgi:Zn finger protein HypA/HybF involved in hydrogenase expression
MGEREVVEQVEVTDEKEVYLCDFCGRSSDEFDGDFNNVYTNPEITQPNSSRFYTKPFSKERTAGCVRITMTGWRSNMSIDVEHEAVRHYCDECHSAHVEVHDDDN